MRVTLKKAPVLKSAILAGVVITAGAACAFGPFGLHDDSAGSARANSENKEEKGEAKGPMEVAVTPVHVHCLHSKSHIPGELMAFRNVELHAKVKGFVEKMLVDRGSVVKKGQLLVKLSAPELEANVREAKSRLMSAKAGLAESKAKVSSQQENVIEAQAIVDRDTDEYKRLVEAAKVPGAVAGQEVDIAEKNMQSSKAHVSQAHSKLVAAKANLEVEKGKIGAAEQEYQSVQSLEQYLYVKAPFDGVITDRLVHEGSLAGTKSSGCLLRIQQISPLRLVVYVPEDAVSGLEVGADIDFSVHTFPGKVFCGRLARIGEAVKSDTRTMAIELDVPNKEGALKPGMFANINLPECRHYQTKFVPASSIASTLDREFVSVVRNGKVKNINVTRGKKEGDLLEVFGELRKDDEVIIEASDDIKDGTPVKVRREKLALHNEAG